MTPAEKDALNRALCKELGQCWHEYDTETLNCIHCKKSMWRKDSNNPGYAADPRLVLREMMKREDWDSFCDYIGYLDFSEDGYPLRYVRMDYILDTTGKLRDAAIDFLKEARL